MKMQMRGIMMHTITPAESAAARGFIAQAKRYYVACAQSKVPAGRDTLLSICNLDLSPDFKQSAAACRAHARSLNPAGGKGYLALRTLGGKGRVELPQGSVICKTGTLLVLKWTDLLECASVDKHWRVWCFDFTASKKPAVPLGVLLHVASDNESTTLFEEVYTRLGDGNALQEARAALDFFSLLYNWVAGAALLRKKEAAPFRMEKLVKYLYANLDQNISVADMAALAGLSEDRFRDDFKKQTGKSPKHYFTHLRLFRAHDLMLLQGHTASEAAEAIGYAALSHFSRAFTKHFGYPPSQVMDLEQK
jgi:AraC-like DNA-binding protein